MPPACAARRAVACQFRLRSPGAAGCERVDDSDAGAVDADPGCHRHASSETVAFAYRVVCAFEGGFRAATAGDNFSYVATSADGWALSQALYESQNWTAQLKVFNWQRLSDLSAAVVSPPLSPAQLAGQEDVAFALDLSQLAPRHLVGGRVYAEVGFTEATLRGMTLSPASVRDRLFVDLTNLADLSQYPPAGGAAAGRAAVRAAQEEEEQERGLWSFFFGETTAAAAAVTVGVVAVTMLFAWTTMR